MTELDHPQDMSNFQDILLAACSDGDIDCMQSLLDNPTAANDQTPALLEKMLEHAAKAGQVAIVQNLVFRKQSFRINRDLALAVAIGASAEIYEAIWSVQPDIIHTVLGHTGDPITMAVAANNVPVLSFLLAKGADPNAGRYLSRWSPITLAAIRSSVEVTQLLISFGARIPGTNAIQYAAGGGRLDLLRCLLDNGADVNDTPDYHHIPKLFDHLETALHSAVRSKNLAVVNFLLEHGANPELQDSEGKTVLMRAEESQHLEVIQSLKDRETSKEARLGMFRRWWGGGKA